MGNPPKSLNDKAWEQLFLEHDILSRIETDGEFKISAAQIKKYREPRLMAKFDHTINLPAIFSANKLAILPVTRGDYVISHFEAYHKFEDNEVPIIQASMPSYIQSLDPSSISSEAVALNCAVAAGITADFLQDEDLMATVSGRMGSGAFDFNIANSKSNSHCSVKVSNSQIEIDAAYEGVSSLALFEAKRDLSEDFLIRQLYYPYRVWRNRVTKAVRPLFLVYSNGIYNMYEYEFQDPKNYNSLVLVQHKKYSVEDMSITLADIQGVLKTALPVPEPEVPFPQADSFSRVINLCELLEGQELSRTAVTDEYAFDVRQTNYYTDAARYLGLINKNHDNNENNAPDYSLSETGKRVLTLNFKQRQLAFCNCILSHKVFRDTFKKCLAVGRMPQKNEIVQIMKDSNLYNVHGESTFERRSSTVKSWLNWILSLTNAE